jgi:flavin-binding protein dodecin
LESGTILGTRRLPMSVARITEIKAASTKSFDDAIKEGVARAAKTLENVTSAWVASQEVKVNGKGKVTEYRVLLKVTFILKD